MGLRLYYTTKKGELQVGKRHFWFISLIALMVVGAISNWNIPVRIAVAANAVIVLISVFAQIRSWRNGKEEN